MTLVEAIEKFLASRRQIQNTPAQIEPARAGVSDHTGVSLELVERSLKLLADHFPNLQLVDLTDRVLRDFLACWYVEEATVTATKEMPVAHPDAQTLLTSLQIFFKWAKDQSGETKVPSCLAVLDELRETLPRAIAIGIALSQYTAECGGPFTHAEFLTSFEEGGRSQYDIDKTGQSSICEGYFRITKVETDKIEAEELILGEPIAPILCPGNITSLLREGYILNLELLHATGSWKILNCGFAYPPATEI